MRLSIHDVKIYNKTGRIILINKHFFSNRYDHYLFFGDFKAAYPKMFYLKDPS